jgi:hypothetical protein
LAATPAVFLRRNSNYDSSISAAWINIPSLHGGSNVLLPTYLGLKGRSAKMPATFFPHFRGRMATQMTYSIFARDGTSRIVLKRESREAAERKARELTDLGWFEVRIDDEVPIEEAEKKQLRVT